MSLKFELVVNKIYVEKVKDIAMKSWKLFKRHRVNFKNIQKSFKRIGNTVKTLI